MVPAIWGQVSKSHSPRFRRYLTDNCARNRLTSVKILMHHNNPEAAALSCRLTISKSINSTTILYHKQWRFTRINMGGLMIMLSTIKHGEGFFISSFQTNNRTSIIAVSHHRLLSMSHQQKGDRAVDQRAFFFMTSELLYVIIASRNPAKSVRKWKAWTNQQL